MYHWLVFILHFTIGLNYVLLLLLKVMFRLLGGQGDEDAASAFLYFVFERQKAYVNKYKVRIFWNMYISNSLFPGQESIHPERSDRCQVVHKHVQGV